MIDDYRVMQAMIHSGGSFVSALGKAAMVADATNLQKIKTAFPEYWEKYSQVAERRRPAKEQE